MTSPQPDRRLVVIGWCYECPHNDHSACSAKNVKCGLTKKRISGINCTQFPKTCPLPRPNMATDNILRLTDDGAIWFDSTKSELMEELIMKGVEVQMPIEKQEAQR